MFASKKNGSFCLCVAYRESCAVTDRDSYLILQMNEFINSSGDTKVFLTLDADGIYPIDMHEFTKTKIAFVSRHGLFQYTRVSFEPGYSRNV